MRSKIYLIATFILFGFAFFIFLRGVMILRPNVVFSENIGLICSYVRYPNRYDRVLKIVPLDSPAGRAGILEGDVLVRFDGIECNRKNQEKIRQILAKKWGKFGVGDYVTVELKRGDFEIERDIYFTRYKTWEEAVDLSTITSGLALLTSFGLLYLLVNDFVKFFRKTE